MRLIFDTPENIALRAAKRYSDLLAAKPNAVLGFATGSTPLGLYKQLIELYRNKEISFKEATTFNLDEYAGIGREHPQSYYRFMMEHLFSHIDLDPSRIHLPSGTDVSDAAMHGYEDAIKSSGGIDLQLLGIGNNGHIGFNEPGTPFASQTHLVTLSDSTRIANARFFETMDKVPTRAVTMGIRTVMNARSIIMIALGKSKAAAVHSALFGEVTPACPASVLQLHPNVEVYLDMAAGGEF